MLEKNLMKMLRENGAKIEETFKGLRYSKISGQVVTWLEQNGIALVVMIRDEKDESDILTDYVAGSRFYTLKSIYKKLFVK